MVGGVENSRTKLTSEMPPNRTPTQDWFWKYYKRSKDLTKYMIGMKKT